MPATSQSQKTLACMALAYKRHGESAIKSVKNKKAVIDMANSMSEEQLKEYCLQPVQGE